MIGPLTGRLRELTILIAEEHHTVRVAARRMGISRRTAESYVRVIADRCPGDARPLRKLLAHQSALLAPVQSDPPA